MTDKLSIFLMIIGMVIMLSPMFYSIYEKEYNIRRMPERVTEETVNKKGHVTKMEYFYPRREK